MCAHRLAWRKIAFTTVASLLLVSAAFAQLPTPQQFQANPAQVLSGNPTGGAQLTALIRQLVIADPADLPVVINLLANVNAEQAAAIGAGLGQAALASVRTNQPYATQIQQALAAANNSDASTAYAAVTGNQPIGAVGGGGAPGSNGGVGGQTNPLGSPVGTGGAEAIGNGGVPTGPFAYGGGVTGASLTGSVSPSR
jgi:hypothetical protein